MATAWHLKGGMTKPLPLGTRDQPGQRPHRILSRRPANRLGYAHGWSAATSRFAKGRSPSTSARSASAASRIGDS